MAETPCIFLTAAALLRYNVGDISPEKGASFVAFVGKKSVLPIYLVGATWLVWSVTAPLYRPTHYVMAALSSAAVYYLGKILLPNKGDEIPAPQPQDAAPSVPQSQSEPQTAPEISAPLREQDPGSMILSADEKTNDA